MGVLRWKIVVRTASSTRQKRRGCFFYFFPMELHYIVHKDIHTAPPKTRFRGWILRVGSLLTRYGWPLVCVCVCIHEGDRPWIKEASEQVGLGDNWAWRVMFPLCTVYCLVCHGRERQGIKFGPTL